MIRTVLSMLTCHFTARRLHHYLDADPAALLTEAEVRRIEAHLAVCERCAGAAADFTALRRALRGLSRRPAPATVTRLHQLVDDLVDGGAR